MRSVLILFLVISCSAAAESPQDLYSVEDVMKNKFTVNFVVTEEDIHDACNKESHRRKYGGFNTEGFLACSFWRDRKHSGSDCTIVVPKEVNNNILAHEFRHCLQGHFH